MSSTLVTVRTAYSAAVINGIINTCGNTYNLRAVKQASRRSFFNVIGRLAVIHALLTVLVALVCLHLVSLTLVDLLPENRSLEGVGKVDS